MTLILKFPTLRLFIVLSLLVPIQLIGQGFINPSLYSLQRQTNGEWVTVTNETFLGFEPFYDGLSAVELQTPLDRDISWIDTTGLSPFSYISYSQFYLPRKDGYMPGITLDRHSFSCNRAIAIDTITLNGQLEYRVGFINKVGELVIPVKYVDAEPFVNGYAFVELENELCVIIDTTGREVLTFPRSKYETKKDLWNYSFISEVQYIGYGTFIVDMGVVYSKGAKSGNTSKYACFDINGKKVSDCDSYMLSDPPCPDPYFQSQSSGYRCGTGGGAFRIYSELKYSRQEEDSIRNLINQAYQKRLVGEYKSALGDTLQPKKYGYIVLFYTSSSGSYTTSETTFRGLTGDFVKSTTTSYTTDSYCCALYCYVNAYRGTNQRIISEYGQVGIRGSRHRIPMGYSERIVVTDEDPYQYLKNMNLQYYYIGEDISISTDPGTIYTRYW